ncbi:MAG: hypothetical protein R3C03_05645 [Pirellulaceae bacterium]
MQKGFCIFALAVAGLVFLLFLADLILGMAGMATLAPFRYANMIMDIVFLVCAGTGAVLSLLTYRQIA